MLNNSLAARSHKNLKPLFDFYLRTIDKIAIAIQKTTDDSYSITSSNVPMPIPIEVTTSSGVESFVLEKAKSLMVSSKTLLIVDPNGNYFTEIKRLE